MRTAGAYRQRRSTKDLAVYDPDSDTEFFYLRPRDIAVYVAAGTLDVGITGRDMPLEPARPAGAPDFSPRPPPAPAVSVAAGPLDVGITGRDMLLETAPAAGEGPTAVEVMPLGFGRSSLRFASPAGSGAPA